MLTSLKVQNYALLDEIEITFGPGLTILTGETGSGKSILVGALGLILGGRATTDAIRTGASSATVEGLFEWTPEKTEPALPAELDFDTTDGSLVIRRELTRDGRNRCLVNGHLATVATLKRIGEALVDLHGQHDHQSLLDPKTHIGFLDGSGDIAEVKASVAMAYRLFSERVEALRTLDDEIRAARERRELYQYQLAQLTDAAVSSGEDAALERELAILQNAGLLIQTAAEAVDALSQKENAIIDLVSQVIRSVEDMERIDGSLNETVVTARSARYQLEDVVAYLQSYRDRIDFDPERLSEIQDRLELLKQFKRKYGGSLEEVCAYRDRIAEEISKIETADTRRDRMQSEVEQARESLTVLAQKLSKVRRRLASRLEERVMEELAELGMPRTRFQVKLDWRSDDNGPLSIEGARYSVDASGMDQVEFMISPNLGEELKPLASIASGGEISRIMLALKVILAQSDRIATLVFDEIDIGIGGRVAEAVGQKLKGLSHSHQVLCVTHLHQVACWGNAHLTVVKKALRGRTVTEIKQLDADGRVQEIARMLAGETVDDLAMTHAREMLRRAAKNQLEPPVTTELVNSDG